MAKAKTEIDAVETDVSAGPRAGDVVRLRDQEGGFTDPVTGFDLSRDQEKELTEPIGQRTHQALVSGGLLVVK